MASTFVIFLALEMFFLHFSFRPEPIVHDVNLDGARKSVLWAWTKYLEEKLKELICMIDYL